MSKKVFKFQFCELNQKKKTKFVVLKFFDQMYINFKIQNSGTKFITQTFFFFWKDSFRLML